MSKIGIDPGITGAIAVLRGSRLMEAIDMPTMPKISGKGNQINARALYHLMKRMTDGYDVEGIYIERVAAMPSQGVTSVFSFGKSAGIIEGVCACLGIPMHFPTPQSWKKKAGLTGKDKDHARTHAINLYPEASESLKRKKDIGRADAILIATYGS